MSTLRGIGLSGRKPLRAFSLECQLGNRLDLRHGWPGVQPVTQAGHGFRIAAGQDFNGSVGAVDGVTGNPEPAGLLAR